LSSTVQSTIEAVRAQPFAAALAEPYLAKLEATRSLSLAAPNSETAAMFAAAKGHLDCVRFLISIGGGTGLMDILRRHPDRLESRYPALLTASPPLLDLPAKQAWLVWRLEAVVGGADADALCT
jgi:hypothetical protein